MKKLILFALILGHVISANAQTATVSNHSFTINTIGFSYNYEHALGAKTTIVGRVGLLTPALGWSSWDGFGYSIAPGISVEPRYYYNAAKRLRKNKTVDFNAANYVALNVEYIFEPIAHHSFTTSPGLLLSPNWGMRRVYNNRWLLEFNTGINCFIDSDFNSSLSLRTNLKCGIVF